MQVVVGEGLADLDLLPVVVERLGGFWRDVVEGIRIGTDAGGELSRVGVVMGIAGGTRVWISSLFEESDAGLIWLVGFGGLGCELGGEGGAVGLVLAVEGG